MWISLVISIILFGMTAIVLGSTGLTGELLLRLLNGHPEVERVYAVSQSRGGEKMAGGLDKVEGYIEMSAVARLRGDVLFSALPHLRSAVAWRGLARKMVVIDLAADMRVPDEALFLSRYGTAPEAIAGVSVAYGIPELFAGEVGEADVIANPGCFPTAGLIPLLPLARDGLLRRDIMMSAITGISGAGRSRDSNYLFIERSENCGAYKPGTEHRHWIEFAHYLRGHSVRFVPHLAPLSRGIAMTIFCRLRDGAGEKDVIYSFAEAYKGSEFVRYTGERIPQTADVRGSNRCDFSWRVGDEGELLLFSAIDNLMKGASGQAVQNMNVRMGFEARAGLPIEAGL